MAASLLTWELSVLVHLAVNLDVHLVEMPFPVAEPFHAAHSLPANIRGKQRAEAWTEANFCRDFTG